MGSIPTPGTVGRHRTSRFTVAISGASCACPHPIDELDEVSVERAGFEVVAPAVSAEQTVEAHGDAANLANESAWAVHDYQQASRNAVNRSRRSSHASESPENSRCPSTWNSTLPFVCPGTGNATTPGTTSVASPPSISRSA